MSRIEKLIELVREKKELYDPNDKNDGNRAHTKQIWDEIAETLDFSSGDECEAEFAELLDSYKSYKKLLITRSGNPAKAVATWQYAKAMQFTDDYVKCKKLTTETEPAPPKDLTTGIEQASSKPKHDGSDLVKLTIS